MSEVFLLGVHLILLSLEKKIGRKNSEKNRGVNKNREEYFFCQNTTNFEIWSWIFFHLKKFWNFLPKYREWPSYRLIMTEVSKKMRKIFFSQNTPDFEIWSWIFVHLKKFLKFFAEIRWIIFL